MAEKDGIKKAIKEFIIRNYLKPVREVSLGDDESFLKRSILDSIGVIELANFLQKTYSIRVKPADIVPENFDTINNLEKYVAGKMR